MEVWGEGGPSMESGAASKRLGVQLAHGGTLSPGQERRELGSPGMSGDQFKVTAVLMAGREGGQILWGALGSHITEREEPENRDLLFFSWPC